MLRINNYTTILLSIIVGILIFGVGIAVYYVLDLDWFSKQLVDIYNEPSIYREQSQTQIEIQKEVGYDIAKRTYNILLNTDEFNIIIYKDGTVGITMLENQKYEEIVGYKDLLNKEQKIDLTNIIRAFNVQAAEDGETSNYILLLDNNGNLYVLSEKELIEQGKYSFAKIEGMAKIIDVTQITNDGLTENTTGINVIAIDQESNELLLTNYLIKDIEQEKVNIEN